MEKNEKIRLLKIPYYEYITVVKDFAIEVDTETRLAYINPDYKHILSQMNYEPDYCEEPLTWEDIKEILELDVKKWNLSGSRPGEVMTFLSDFLNREVLDRLYKEYLDSKIDDLNK